MMSLRRVISGRLGTNLQQGHNPTVAARRSYGDPGPQTSAHRKSQRNRLREATLGDSGRGRGVDADVLNSILSTEPLLVSEPQPRREYVSGGDRDSRRPRVPILPRRDGGVRRDRPARVFDQETGRWEFLKSDKGMSGNRDPGDDGNYRNSAPRFSHRASRSGDIRPSSPMGQSGAQGHRKDGDPFATSRSLREHIQASSSPMPNAQIEAAERIIATASKSAVNVVVWNQLLALLGREGRFEKMWKSFNDMKKTGIKPTAHTYTSLLNSFAGLSHSDAPFSANNQRHIDPPPNHLSRVLNIWAQARTHLSTLSSAPSGLSAPESITTDTEGNTCGPINAYLKFLAKYRMWGSMWDLFQQRGESGPEWDVVGYTTMFQALLSLARRQAAQSGREGGGPEKVVVGPLARQLWDGAVQGLDGKSGNMGGIDNHLASLAVTTLMMGRPEDQRFALDLIPSLWGLIPMPTATTSLSIPDTDPAPESDVPATTLPKLQLDVKVATTLLHALTSASRPTLAAYYATQMISKPRMRKEADPPFLYACATTWADIGDISSILDLLQKHAHRTPEGGWRNGFWYDCLTAARWARVEGDGGGKGDWEGIKTVLGYMGVIPKSQPATQTDDSWKRKRAPVKPSKPVSLDAKSMTIILKTALGRNKEQVLEAVKILDKGGLADVLRQYEQALRNATEQKSQAGMIDKRWEWSNELSKEMGRAMEGLGERDWTGSCGSATREILSRLLRPAKVQNDQSRDSRESADGNRRERRNDRSRDLRESADGNRREWRNEDRGRSGFQLAWKR